MMFSGIYLGMEIFGFWYIGDFYRKMQILVKKALKKFTKKLKEIDYSDSFNNMLRIKVIPQLIYRDFYILKDFSF